MSSTIPLHDLVLPAPDVCDASELFVRLTGEADVEGTVLRLGAEATASFDTYFNCLTVSAWNRAARLDQVVASVDVDGPCTVEVWNTDAGGSRRIARVAAAGGSTDIAVPAPETLDGICWMRVVAGPAPVRLRHGGWRTSTPTRRPVRLAVVMTTYRRERYVRRNLELLDRYARAGADRLRDVHVTVVDNGRSLEVDPADFAFPLEILPNPNLGGAGGFARGLIAHRLEGWATHVVFADDDIVLPPAIIDRSATFLALTRDDRTCLASAMIDQSDPVRQYECGAGFDSRHRHPTTTLRGDLDLTDRSALVANAQAAPIGYGGWWFFAFPIDLTDDNPLPVFVRGDDVEFGLSHCRDRIEVMNGIGVWHLNFDYKNTPATFHLEARNHPLVGVLTDPGYGRRHLVERFGLTALRFLLALKYASAEHVLAGVREFLEGPDRWLGLDHEAEFARIGADPEERAATLDPADRSAPMLDGPPGGDLLALVTLGGHLLPARWSTRPPVAVPIQARPLGPMLGRERVVYFDRPSGEGFVAVRDRRRFFTGLVDLTRTLLAVWRRFPVAAARYRQRRAELVGTAYWQRQFRSAARTLP